MVRKLLFFALLVVMVLAVAAPALAKKGRAHNPGPAVYVSSQGLYYETFVSAESLPPHGPFQKLENGVTEFGPGQPGYLGGRWWIDVNGNDEMDAGDTYLLCPLLGPGTPGPPPS